MSVSPVLRFLYLPPPLAEDDPSSTVTFNLRNSLLCFLLHNLLLIVNPGHLRSLLCLCNHNRLSSDIRFSGLQHQYPDPSTWLQAVSSLLGSYSAGLYSKQHSYKKKTHC